MKKLIRLISLHSNLIYVLLKAFCRGLETKNAALPVSVLCISIFGVLIHHFNKTINMGLN